MVRWISVAVLVVASSAAAEDDDFDLLGIMATSKFAGGCGIIYQMSHFQETTKLKGGDEFITRFLNTEAARLGLSLEQYLQQCVTQTDIYGEMEALAEELFEK